MSIQTQETSLTIGSLIGRYKIIEVLGIGGFGITYKAMDTKLDRLVAVKEYLPSESGIRMHNATTVNAQQGRVDEYTHGLKRFLDEATVLAKFHHPNIIMVMDHFELNNTAYFIMSYEQGQTLGQYIKAHNGSIPEDTLKTLFKPILKGLQHIHEQQYYHRDIKPNNIYLRDEGEPVLIDFGAARQATSAHSRSLTSLISVGYAPNEQYGSDQKKQGAWTDLYAVGATLYRCISGKDPCDAPTRQNAMFEQEDDPLIAAVILGKDKYSPEFLQLIDYMLAPAIKNRPQTAQTVLNALKISEPKKVVQHIEEVKTTAATQIVKPSPPIIETPIYVETANNINQPLQTPAAAIKTNTTTHWLGITGGVLGVLAVGLSQIESLKSLFQPSETPAIVVPAKKQGYSAEQVQAFISEELKKQRLNQAREQRKTLNAQQQRLNNENRQNTQNQQKRQRITALLAGAKADVAKMRLTTPANNNAFDKYQQILKLDPYHTQAKRGLTTISDKYLSLAKKEHLKFDGTKKANNYLAKAKKVQSHNPNILKVSRLFDKNNELLGDGNKWYKQKNYTQAFNAYYALAEQGDIWAQSRIGWMYYSGKGVTSDPYKATLWHRKAAKQGNATAQNNLGVQYRKGQGVTQDYSQALYWYRKAAKQGNASAQSDLGYMYDLGKGVVENDTTAVLWYRKAAKQGDSTAQSNLGIMYQNGTGVTQSESNAIYWFRKAAKQGYKDAQEKLTKRGLSW
mgnify:CR=1 FL=1